MGMRYPARPLGWAWPLMLLVWVLFMSACGGGYSEAAHPGYGTRATSGGYPAEPMAERAAEYEEDSPAAMPPPAPMDANEDYDFVAQEISAPAKMAQAGPMPATPTPPAVPQPPAEKPDPMLASDAVPIQQVLIYTAQMRMAVFEVDKSLSEVEALAKSLGGFLSHRTDTQITIRVPAAQFDDALKGIAGMGDVLTRNVQVEDVTEEYLDVTLRLKNARQVRERIAELLKNAKTVEESLQVERELNRLSGEIERLEGRLKYLRSKAQYSTITVTFQPEQVDDVRPAFQLPFPWLRELGLGRLMNLR